MEEIFDFLKLSYNRNTVFAFVRFWILPVGGSRAAAAGRWPGAVVGGRRVRLVRSGCTLAHTLACESRNFYCPQTVGERRKNLLHWGRDGVRYHLLTRLAVSNLLVLKALHQ